MNLIFIYVFFKKMGRQLLERGAIRTQNSELRDSFI